MENVLVKDVNYLKGEYATGFEKVKSALKGGLIPKSFNKDVEGDILELFIRNQDNNKEFNEVIGGDLDNFIKEIVNVYFEVTSTKTKVMGSVGAGMVIFGVFFGMESFRLGKTSLASLTMSIFACLLVTAIILFSYKISKKINHKNTNYIAGGVGFFIAMISRSVYENVEYFKNAMGNEINMILSIAIILVTVTIGFIMIKKAEKQN